MTPPPLILLGVSRSGTTLLRVMLDRSPDLAIPDESFFVPLLARRHGGRVDPGRFLDDVSRIPTIASWGVTTDDVAAFLRPGSSAGEAISSIFEAYATKAGKRRWGDKTPMYMRHLPLLERLFSDAQFVHLIRDGRDTATSFLQMPEGTFTRTWAHPTSPAQFACLWRTEVRAARSLGARVGPARYQEVRYEELAADPTRVVREICRFAGVAFESAMVEYAGTVDVASKPHQQRLLEPPRAGVRDWRVELRPKDVTAFEYIAGDLLGELGYELTDPPRPPGARARLALLRYRTVLGAWSLTVAGVQRSPWWRRRHPPIRESQSGAAFRPR